MGQSHSTESRCAELDRLAVELTKAYEQLDEAQILLLRESLSFIDGLEESAHAVTTLHRQIASHRMSCERCIELGRTFDARVKQGGQSIN